MQNCSIRYASASLVMYVQYMHACTEVCIRLDFQFCAKWAKSQAFGLISESKGDRVCSLFGWTLSGHIFFSFWMWCMEWSGVEQFREFYFPNNILICHLSLDIQGLNNWGNSLLYQPILVSVTGRLTKVRIIIYIGASPKPYRRKYAISNPRCEYIHT